MSGYGRALEQAMMTGLLIVALVVGAVFFAAGYAYRGHREQKAECRTLMGNAVTAADSLRIHAEGCDL